MLYLIFQCILFQLLFLIVYDLFLKRNTFFSYNRWYLLITSALSIVIPFIKIDSFNTLLDSNSIIVLPEIVLDSLNNQSNTNYSDDTVVSLMTVANGYVLITLIIFSVFVINLIKILKLIHQNPKTIQDNLTIVHLKETNTAFSFFNFIFLGDTLSSTERQSIFEHEKIHAIQKHSIDLLWFEVLKIVLWFNPLVYAYQIRISNIHEYLADQKAVKTSKSEYYQQLLQQVFSVKTCAFINPFFKQSLIKKRIIMLQKSKTKQSHVVKYLLLVPMVLGMLVYSSCSNETESYQEAIVSVKTEKIVANDSTSLDVDIPFSTIDQAPLLEACKTLVDKDQQKKCFSEEVSKHVLNNFNTKLADNLDLKKGLTKVYVSFKISKTGAIIDVISRAVHPDLEAEAYRVINSLPKMIPGMHEGKAVDVAYGLPIAFKIN